MSAADGASGCACGEAAMRIDALLWHIRVVRSRTLAKKLAGKGHVRLNGRRVTKAHQLIRIGDVLTVPAGDRVRVVRIDSLPEKRVGASQLVHFITEQLPDPSVADSAVTRFAEERFVATNRRG